MKKAAGFRHQVFGRSGSTEPLRSAPARMLRARGPSGTGFGRVEGIGPSAILITGPGGVGKTTVAFEVCRLLEAAGVSHAMIDADELDRVFPAPVDDPDGSDLTRRNLAAVWANLSEAGAQRLILTMVASSLEDELPLIRQAIPEISITLVRLRASEHDLLERVRRREVGSGYDYQVPRTIEQARLMQREPAGDRLVVDTSGRPVSDVAREVLQRAGWPV